MKNSIIIVLGNLMDKLGQLNKVSCSRLDLAIDIFRKNKYSFIITCGWDYRDDSNIALADAMKSYIVKVIGVKTTKKKELSEREDKSLNVFYKTFNGIKSGDDVLIYKRLCREQPYYNGDIYPKV